MVLLLRILVELSCPVQWAGYLSRGRDEASNVNNDRALAAFVAAVGLMWIV
jgi:hypothetical protein